MINSFLLSALGLILIFLEFYLPGIILGASGVILLFISLFIFSSESDSPIAIALFIIGNGIALILTIRFALWKIRHTKSRFNIYSDKDQEGFQASSFDQSAIGKIGIVESDLKPGGYIIVNGKQHQAISQSGYIVKGTEVFVTGGQEESLIVKTHSKKDL